jgi:hypothetical protein
MIGDGDCGTETMRSVQNTNFSCKEKQWVVWPNLVPGRMPILLIKYQFVILELFDEVCIAVVHENKGPVGLYYIVVGPNINFKVCIKWD